MSNIIDKVKVSGTIYTLSATSSGGTNAVEITQDDYDALVSGGTVDPTVFYIITDAQSVDISNYWTSAQTNSAIDAATSGKVDTSSVVSSVTSASTDSQIPTAKAVFDAIPQGGGVNVVQTTGTSTTDVMSQDAVTTQLNNKANKSAAVGGYKFGDTNNVKYLQYTDVSKSNIGNSIYYPKINGKGILTNNSTFAQNNYNFQLLETSAVTSSMTSSSTDSEIPSAKCVYDQLDGLKLQQITQAAYDALVSGGTVDSGTVYIIVN